MGKITGFLEIDRQDRTYEPAADRVRHFREFIVPVERGRIGQAGRPLHGLRHPYRHPGCPVNNQIPDWNDLVYHSDWQEAAQNLHSTNNFPR